MTERARGAEHVDVSVILLTYNHEPYIHQAVESVLAQTTDAVIEVLISEDCSTDGTRAIVEGYAGEHPDRIRLFLSEQNRNDIEVYLRAYRAARGEFVAYLDGDDYWLENKLERQLAHFREHPDDVMCYHAAVVVDDDGTSGTRRYTEYRGMQELLLANPAPSAAVLFRRRALPELPAWFADQDYIDWPLAVLLAQRGGVAYLDEPLSVYREHAAGVYSGASYRQQREWDVSFLETMHANLGSEYAAETRLALATARAALARGHRFEGKRAQMTREMLRSLRLLPSHPRLPAGTRLRELAAGLAPGPYEAARTVRDRLRRRAAPREEQL